MNTLPHTSNLKLGAHIAAFKSRANSVVPVLQFHHSWCDFSFFPTFQTNTDTYSNTHDIPNFAHLFHFHILNQQILLATSNHCIENLSCICCVQGGNLRVMRGYYQFQWHDDFQGKNWWQKCQVDMHNFTDSWARSQHCHTIQHLFCLAYYS